MTYLLIKFLQDPLKHGFDEHSSISDEQNFPVNPLLQVHMKSLAKSSHSPLGKHGLLEHSSTLVSHLLPEKPGGQEHIYPRVLSSDFITEVQFPPFLQAGRSFILVQWVFFISQWPPVKKSPVVSS